MITIKIVACLFAACAIVKDAGASRLVAGAAFGEIWVHSRNAKRSAIEWRTVSKAQKVTSANMRVGNKHFLLAQIVSCDSRRTSSVACAINF